MSENGVKTLWGQEFNMVRRGLAEGDVVAFVTKLIDERDSLIKRQQHLDNLQRLAEKSEALGTDAVQDG